MTAQKPGLTLFPYQPCYCPGPRDSSLHICAISTGGAEQAPSAWSLGWSQKRWMFISVKCRGHSPSFQFLATALRYFCAKVGDGTSSKERPTPDTFIFERGQLQEQMLIFRWKEVPEVVLSANSKSENRKKHFFFFSPVYY